MLLDCSASIAIGSTLAEVAARCDCVKMMRAARPRRASGASAAPSSCHGTSTSAVASMTSPSSTLRAPVSEVG